MPANPFNSCIPSPFSNSRKNLASTVESYRQTPIWDCDPPVKASTFKNLHKLSVCTLVTMAQECKGSQFFISNKKKSHIKNYPIQIQKCCHQSHRPNNTRSHNPKDRTIDIKPFPINCIEYVSIVLVRWSNEYSLWFTTENPCPTESNILDYK